MEDWVPEVDRTELIGLFSLLEFRLSYWANWEEFGLISVVFWEMLLTEFKLEKFLFASLSLIVALEAKFWLNLK
jgi:hypothetical protein